MLEGEFVFEVEGKRIYAGPGCTVHAPRGQAHRFQNAGTTVGRLLTVSQPAGLDAFFTDIDRATGGANVPNPAIVLPIFEKYGLEPLGPPLPARVPQECHAVERSVAD